VIPTGSLLATNWNPQLALVHERELKKGNRNRATLAVARKLVTYMLAVDKTGIDFVLAHEADAA
jgi:transposase